MKILFMSMVLFLLADPALANQSKPSECLQMYQKYLNDYSTGRSQVMNFLDSCMPANHVRNDEPLHRKLLQIVDDNKKIVTVRT